MIARILVPLDETEFSQQVLPTVRDLAEQTGASIRLLIVVVPPDDAGGAGISQTGALVGARQPRAEAGAGLEDPAAVATGRANKEYLEAIATPLRSSGLTVETEVLFGHVVDRVIAAIDAHNIDMVALSTHARTGLARTIMGSVAEQLVRQSNKPVLLVRPEGA